MTNGLLWFCGRKSHMFQQRTHLLYPIQCEAIFNQHPEVKRSALSGAWQSTVERNTSYGYRKKRWSISSGKIRSRFESELLLLAKK